MSDHISQTGNKVASPPLPAPTGSAGLQYAQECIEKLERMAAFCPTVTMANNVSNMLISCADSIRFEIEYLGKRGIQ